MSNDSMSITLVNHVTVDIARPPEIVWRAILDDYVEGTKFRAIGYSIVPLARPEAFLGGYRMQLEKEGVVVDRRDCIITEFDESARRLSLVADYLAVPAGMKVYATYHAQAVESGTRYALDCHSTLGIERPADDSRASVEAVVAALHEQYDAAMNEFLGGVKSGLEAA